MKISLVLLLAMFAVGMSAPATTCPEIMSDAGLDEYFGTAVAHRLHSLTLEDLRYYFKEDAPEENNIPTVSFDLSANAKRVLPHAPLNGYDTSFKSIAMRHADEVLSKMNRKDWAIKNYSILEKMVHAMHMSELWEQARAIYREFELAPPSEEMCSCVSDSKENGVLAELQLLALKIKFPGLTSGQPDLPYGRRPRSLPSALANRKAIYEISYTIKTNPMKMDSASREKFRRFERKLKAFDFDGEEDEVVDRVMEELQDDDQGLSEHLDGEEGWQAWKQGFKNMDTNDNFQFAMFIYCKLN